MPFGGGGRAGQEGLLRSLESLRGQEEGGRDGADEAQEGHVLQVGDTPRM